MYGGSGGGPRGSRRGRGGAARRPTPRGPAAARGGGAAPGPGAAGRRPPPAPLGLDEQQLDGPAARVGRVHAGGDDPPGAGDEGGAPAGRARERGRAGAVAPRRGRLGDRLRRQVVVELREIHASLVYPWEPGGRGSRRRAIPATLARAPEGGAA